MQNPFSRPDTLLLSADLQERILNAEIQKEQEQIFLDYLADVAEDDPNELAGFVRTRTGTFPIDIARLTLGFVMERTSVWEPDRLACFLLEIVDDHPRFHYDPSLLIDANLPQMLELENAGLMIWELLLRPPLQRCTE